MRSEKVGFAFTFHELGKLGGMSLTVDICGSYYPGCDATHWDPPEGPDFSVMDVSLVEVCDSNGDCITDWASDRGWQFALADIAAELCEDSRFYESLLNAASSELDDQHEWLLYEKWDQRRDEMRGC